MICARSGKKIIIKKIINLFVLYKYVSYLCVLNLTTMLLPTIEKIPMTCYRLTFPQGEGKVYDVFLQDTTDHSSCVNITDENGDQLPFDEWDNVLMFLNIKSN